MKTSKWEQQREKRRKESLECHGRLHKLFVEDRLTFERERKKMIDDLISRSKDEERRNRLRALQELWDKKMRSAGSPHNRFVLAQSLFWSHFYETWHPAFRQLKSRR